MLDSERNPMGDTSDDTQAEAVIDALHAAVDRAAGDRSASARVADAFNRLDPNHVCGAMAAWVGTAGHISPLPPGTARADCEPRTGKRWDLATTPLDVALGRRLFAALANDDTATAAALWATAIGKDVATEVLMVVLHCSGSVIAHHSADRHP